MNVRGMRKKVTIQVATEANNSYGEPVKSWANFAANRWAEVVQGNDSEVFVSQRVQDINNITFRMRYIDGVKSKMKLVYGGEDYDIVSAINPDSLKREMIIQCIKRN